MHLGPGPQPMSSRQTFRIPRFVGTIYGYPAPALYNREDFFFSMKILVTGGAGFIGSNLVDRLVRDQCGDVCVLDNFSRGRIENLARSSNAIRIVDGNILD